MDLAGGLLRAWGLMDWGLDFEYSLKAWGLRVYNIRGFGVWGFGVYGNTAGFGV